LIGRSLLYGEKQRRTPFAVLICRLLGWRLRSWHAGFCWLRGSFVGWGVLKVGRQPSERSHGPARFPAIARPMSAVFDGLSKDDFSINERIRLNADLVARVTAEVGVAQPVGTDRKGSQNVKAIGHGYSPKRDFLERNSQGFSSRIPVDKIGDVDSRCGFQVGTLRGGDRFDLLVSVADERGLSQLSNSEPRRLRRYQRLRRWRVGSACDSMASSI